MGLITFVVIAFAATLIGIALQALQQRDGFAWLLMAAAVTFGAYFFSETLPGSTLFEAVTNWGPHVDGFFLIPGLIGAAVLGGLAYLGTQTAPLTARAG